MIFTYLGCILGFSLYVAQFTKISDFPIFYSTANTVLEKGIVNDAIYNTIDSNNPYRIPEAYGKDAAFIYSKFAALLFTPLGLLPYFYAKTLLIFLNILAYLAGIFLFLNFLGFTGRMHLFVWGLSFIWAPFIHIVRICQIDGLLLFLLAGALYLAERQKPLSAGAMIGVAMLFKIYPLALAMVLAVKNWRILLGCLAVFAASFLIPGATSWFAAVPNIYGHAYSIIFLSLKSQTIWMYIFYSLLVGGATALLVYKRQDMSFTHIFALTLPAIYLTMPIVEYCHLTTLIITFLFLFSQIEDLSRLQKVGVIFSILVISIGIIEKFWSIIFVNMIFLWTLVSLQATKRKTSASIAYS
jgi:hypothetical protein